MWPVCDKRELQEDYSKETTMLFGGKKKSTNQVEAPGKDGF